MPRNQALLGFHCSFHSDFQVFLDEGVVLEQAHPSYSAGWLQETLHTLALPKDATVYLVEDSRDKPSREIHNLLTKKSHKSQHYPQFFGICFALLSAN
jgi:hypothetical protein